MKDRSVRIEFLQEGTVGTIYKVIFIDRGVAVGHWPLHGGLALGVAIENWIKDGQRPQ